MKPDNRGRLSGCRTDNTEKEEATKLMVSFPRTDPRETVISTRCAFAFSVSVWLESGRSEKRKEIGVFQRLSGVHFFISFF